jgi:hypothetical protein
VTTEFDTSACRMQMMAIGDACTATVNDMETCLEDQVAQSDAEICSFEIPESCAFFGDADCAVI